MTVPKPFSPEWMALTVRKRKGLGEDDGLIELDEDGLDMTDPRYRPNEKLEEDAIDLSEELGLTSE